MSAIVREYPSLQVFVFFSSRSLERTLAAVVSTLIDLARQFEIAEERKEIHLNFFGEADSLTRELLSTLEFLILRNTNHRILEQYNIQFSDSPFHLKIHSERERGNHGMEGKKIIE